MKEFCLEREVLGLHCLCEDCCSGLDMFCKSLSAMTRVLWDILCSSRGLAAPITAQRRGSSRPSRTDCTAEKTLGLNASAIKPRQ